jgi:hypothetical protein
VREPTNPVSFATMPVPSEADYCAKGANFGPHNLWENRPGAFQTSRSVFATYHNAGVRVFDIENPFQPREAGFFLPRDPECMFDPRPCHACRTRAQLRCGREHDFAADGVATRADAPNRTMELLL